MMLTPTSGYGELLLDPDANLAAFVDSKLLPEYMWQKTWDTEGILSTLPAIASGVIGLRARQIIQNRM